MQQEGGETDQYVEPFVIVDADGKAIGTVEDDDAVVICNFRADRVVEISKAFEYEDFNSFDRVRFPKVLSNHVQVSRNVSNATGEV